MLNTARVPKEIREGIWTEAAQYATDIKNIIVLANKPTASDNQFYKTTGPSIKNMQIFGEIAVVKTSKIRKIRAKLTNCGKSCLFLGRAVNHSSDTYHFLSLETKMIIISRNVPWMNKNYSEWKGITDLNITRLSNQDDDEDKMEPTESEPGRVLQLDVNVMNAPDPVDVLTQGEIWHIQDEQIRNIPSSDQY